jgi:hypothetical protein
MEALQTDNELAKAYGGVLVANYLWGVTHICLVAQTSISCDYFIEPCYSPPLLGDYYVKQSRLAYSRSH